MCYFFLNANRVYDAEDDSAYQFDFEKKKQELEKITMAIFLIFVIFLNIYIYDKIIWQLNYILHSFSFIFLI